MSLPLAFRAALMVSLVLAPPGARAVEQGTPSNPTPASAEPRRDVSSRLEEADPVDVPGSDEILAVLEQAAERLAASAITTDPVAPIRFPNYRKKPLHLADFLLQSHSAFHLAIWVVETPAAGPQGTWTLCRRLPMTRKPG